VKLWVDDIREAPDKTWVQVPNASRAMSCLLSSEVTELSLDHDLGEISMTGYDIAKQMVELSLWPKDIYCHSMNPVGREQILSTLSRYAPSYCRVHW
jgi:hypothetical protein